MFRIPNQFKIRNGRQKDLLINALSKKLPNHAYSIPKNELLRGKLNSLAHKKLVRESVSILNTDKARDRGLFNACVYDLAKNDNNKPIGLLWKLSQVELWHQVFIDEPILKPKEHDSQ